MIQGMCPAGQTGAHVGILRNMHNTVARLQSCAQGVFCPIQHRIPQRILPRDQLLRAVGPVTQQVTITVSRQHIGDFGMLNRNLVDRGIGSFRARHGERIDHPVLRLPFSCNGISHFGCRQNQQLLCRRFDRATVQLDSVPAVTRDDLRLFPKAFGFPITHFSMLQIWCGTVGTRSG